ncbi:glyoxalase [Hydrogenophaga crassostreae]|uniref:Glyoxalase n=1 Tax=Hydrogenophaga crassostreae TaxID=1763535 RepID=A0A167GN14_9BURK|nr:VOC family protein [Hydrogenophaga crassostreae]AOW14851.1 glyoxalase/bleomycin resistance/dioxygenase family protein [Hydrogenophaga crassostreae]OAD39679.1 glyoxalase [Hydrogenophaga crassostreae]
MKRFHAHVAVENLETSIDFYSKLFGHPPTKMRDDYAKWMLEDPRINFAISARGHAVGVNHFGFQVDSAEELAELKRLAAAASSGAVLEQGVSACCYSDSEKHWTIDPQGLAWEHFHTMSDAVGFGIDTENQAGACCIPVRGSDRDAPPAKAACCIPADSSATQGACCG